MNARWLECGILIEADDVSIHKVKITKCDDGIVLLDSKEVEIKDSNISDNYNYGINILGCKKCTISNSHINGNDTGIIVRGIIDKSQNIEMPPAVDNTQAEIKKMQKWNQRYTNKRKNQLILSKDILIKENEVYANGSTGIHLFKDSQYITISKNTVSKTGKIRVPDYKKIRLLLAQMYRNYNLDTNHISTRSDLMGAGILLSCLTNHDTVTKNRVVDNHSYGIVIDFSNDNLIKDNLLIRNHDGIYLCCSAERNSVTHNTSKANSQCGIGINSYHLGKYAPPSDNTISGNDLIDNGFNAYDTSGVRLSESQLMHYLETTPWPKGLRKSIKSNPELLEKSLANFRKHLQPTQNRWDNGTYGNHYSNFDEEQEGFIDKNNDGISEVSYTIPGGNSIDRFPISRTLVKKLQGSAKVSK